ncbi:hypothetical protein ACIP5Y_07570 [Nocardia sp. NPDC088792]|uniref:hypothetical protein n=1 Tax=Nocardia sp. NPDC088792 TaxID=3364332 RepID=UPI00380ACED7
MQGQSATKSFAEHISIESAVAREIAWATYTLTKVNRHLEVLADRGVSTEIPRRLQYEVDRFYQVATAFQRIGSVSASDPSAVRAAFDESVDLLILGYLQLQPLLTFTAGSLALEMDADMWGLPGKRKNQPQMTKAALTRLIEQGRGIVTIGNDLYQYDPAPSPIGTTATRIRGQLTRTGGREFYPTI